MTLTVLNDAQIQALLEELSPEGLIEFQQNLKAALHDYSTGTQSKDDTVSVHQPARTSIYSAATRATTLFMPSASSAGSGIKVITLSSARRQQATSEASAPPLIRPTGAIMLMSPQGEAVGILHASTLTAFRTALASLCLVYKRESIRTLTVFGCGDQAYWHVRLALMLRGSTIRQVNLVNRTFSANCAAILKRFYGVPAAQKAREGWTDCTFGVLTPGYGEYYRLLEEQVLAADVIFCCTPSTEPLFNGSWLTTHEARRKGRLFVAIGSYTPDMRELPVEILRQATKPHENGRFHFHKHAIEGGVVVVDTLDGALKEAGELIDAELSPKQLVELGELVMLHNIAHSEGTAIDDVIPEADSPLGSEGSQSTEIDKLDVSSGRSAMSSVFGSLSSRSSSPSRKSGSFRHRRSSSHGSVGQEKKRKDKDDSLARWLAQGNVIYKSVGLGLMDLVVGMHVVKFAREKGLGSHIEGF